MITFSKLWTLLYGCNHTNIVHEVQAFYPDARCRLTGGGDKFVIVDDEGSYLGDFATTVEKAWRNTYRLLRRRS